MKKNRKRAFTMAEMMVVIIILGVIAALVLPRMIQDHQKKINLAKTAKWYNAISNLVDLKEIDEEYLFDTDNVTPVEYFKEYFKSLDIIKSDSTHTYSLLSGKGVCTYNVCKPNNGGNLAYTFPDGAMIIISATVRNQAQEGRNDEAYKAFAIDPNGQDLFVFAVTQKHGLQPIGAPGAGDSGELFGDYTRDNVRGLSGKGNHAFGCNANKNGFWCSALLILDGWTFKDDYPY